jgi:hypothetical protein
MADSIFKIGADGVDVERIMADINASVAAKMGAGVYKDARIARAERANLSLLNDDESFVRFYMDCLRDSVAVDINDFPIRERRRAGLLLVLLKKLLWKLLKFYTYRLWSQQNQINAMIVAAVEGVDRKYANRVRDLERRLKAVEDRKP